MMKLLKSTIISLFFAPLLIFAQNQAVLPNSGLTPESPFYFLDRLGEALREFLTFNPEAKARLQITFAAERVAEVKIILETKGVNARGLGVAQSRLQAHLAQAATIVEEQKSRGEDVSKLAKELDDDFEAPKNALEQTFKEQKQALKAQEEELKTKIRDARRVGDAAQVESLLKQLTEVKAQKELLELKKEEQEEALEAEEEKLEREMEKKTEAEKAIKEAEEERQEIIVVMDGSGDDDITNVGPGIQATLLKFDKLLAQAKELFAKENYVGAKQLAKQAEKSLDKVEDALEELEEAKEKEEELEKEEAEKEAERLEKKKEKAEQEVKKAEERSRKADSGDEKED